MCDSKFGCGVTFEAVAGSQSELTAVVQLVPWLQAPAIDGATQEEEYAMRAAVDLREIVEDGTELTASLYKLREDATIAESLSFGRESERFAFKAQQTLPSGELSAPQLFLFDQSQLEAWMNSPARHFYCEILVDGLAVLTNERQFNFTLGFGFNTGRAASLEDDFSLQVSAAALADTILHHGTTDIQFTATITEDGSVMASWVYSDGKTEARFDAASGRLDHIHFYKQKDGETRMFAIERKADWIETVETKTDFDALASVISTAAFIMLNDTTKAKIAALFGRSAEIEQVRESMNLYLGAMLQVVSALPSAGEPTESKEDVFWIPIDSSQGGGIKLLQFGLEIHQTFTDKLQGSSLQRYPLDLGNIAFGRPFVVAPELIRRSESGELGPLILALYASTLDYYNQPYVELVTEMALRRMNDDAIQRELSEIVNTAKRFLQASATNPDMEIRLKSGNASSEHTGILSHLNTELLTNWLAADQRKDRLIAYLEKLTINPGTAATPGYSELAAHHYRQVIELGYNYMTGQGLAQDDVKAAELFTASADQGNQYAQANLAMLYDQGRGVAQDIVRAVHWQRSRDGSARAARSLMV